MNCYSKLISVLLVTVCALISLTQCALVPPNRDNYPYSKAFMLHRRAGGMPNLSVVSPLDVLRQKMMLDMMEQRMRNKINANNEFLLRLGKRSGASVAALQQEWLDNLPGSAAEVSGTSNETA